MCFWLAVGIDSSICWLSLGIDNYVGSLEAGKRADIIGFKQINLNPYMSVINSNQDDLTFSMINGKVVRLK